MVSLSHFILDWGPKIAIFPVRIGGSPPPMAHSLCSLLQAWFWVTRSHWQVEIINHMRRKKLVWKRMPRIKQWTLTLRKTDKSVKKNPSNFKNIFLSQTGWSGQIQEQIFCIFTSECVQIICSYTEVWTNHWHKGLTQLFGITGKSEGISSPIHVVIY